MTDSVEPTPPDEARLLALSYDGATVGENLQAAVAAGRLQRLANGKLGLPPVRGPKSSWIMVLNRPHLPCGFRTQVMFEAAYAATAIPHGCSACFKVKVSLRTLRELVAAWQLAKSVDCLSKWGLDLNNSYSQDVYAGYFYPGDLEAARALYRDVRTALDADAKLGPEVAMVIKRGCSQFEAAVGPSDRYAFTPQMAELEAHLWSLFEPSSIADQTILPLADWIDLAFRMGDDTYLDFTGGRRLRPKSVTYEP